MDDDHSPQREERQAPQENGKSEEVDTTEGCSYPLLFVAGLAFGAPLGGWLIGGAVGVTIGLVVGGGIGKALQSLVTSHRDGGR